MWLGDVGHGPGRSWDAVLRPSHRALADEAILVCEVFEAKLEGPVRHRAMEGLSDLIDGRTIRKSPDGILDIPQRLLRYPLYHR